MGIAKQSSNPISRVPSLPHLSIIGRCLSFIYITSHLATKAFYPPLCLRLGGLPSNNGLHELAAPERHSQTITRLLVVSYTTFSSLPYECMAVIFFCLHLLSPIASIFGSRMPYAARTFLSHPLQMPATEPEHCLIRVQR